MAPNSESPGALDAAHLNLDGYLNEPVREILARLGLASNEEPAHPVGDAPGDGGAGGFDPSQMIQPVTDALGSLGSGQMGQPDPVQSFDGINQTLEFVGQQVQQALSGLGADWQGDASTAAQATTQAALADGTKVSDQAATLRSSLATATAAVQNAQARLIEIINVYWAKIAAIGPSIIFPWGIAAAIAAAAEAVTSAGEVMAETRSALAAETATVTAAGAPVDVTTAPGTGGPGMNSLVQLISTATSPVAQAIGSASSASVPSGAAMAPAEASGVVASSGPRGGEPVVVVPALFAADCQPRPLRQPDAHSVRRFRGPRLGLRCRRRRRDPASKRRRLARRWRAGVRPR
ncbi:hypothetical protein H7I76_26865 [Mycolicibacterium vaccae]|nr:hypothetical protein [Mycolicibacterium vaccae]